MKIEIKKVSKTFRDEEQNLETLKDIDMSLDSGEFVAIIGPSGCGKSTLLQLMIGIVKDYEGQIIIDGLDIKEHPPLMSYMHQKDLLMPWRKVKDNIILPLVLSGMKKKKAYEKVKPYYETFGLDGFEEVYPYALSGGMRQRAALLRTFMVDSEVMLFDEPFAALDAINRHKMQDFLLKQCKGFERTIIFITHDIEEAIFLADRIYVLTQRPAQILKEVKIPLKRPRDKRIKTDPEFLEIKKMLTEALE
jgi:NitT/TauT family transport system ATP-binding protein